MTPIQIGIVGLGRAGWGMHCNELAGREDRFAVRAACDLLPDRRARAADRFGCTTYERIEDLIADPAVDLVDIATRSVDHFAHAALALRAGKDVFIEKPMTCTYDEACRLVEIAAGSAGTLYVRHNRRYDTDFLHVQEIIASGILGSVYEIRLARHGFARRDDWQTIKAFGGGQLLNWGPHIIDHALRFLESPVAEVFSDLKRVAAVGDAEDHVKIVLKGQNGRVVDLEISGGVALGEPTYRVFGDRGSLTLAQNEIHLRYLDPAQPLPDRQPNPGDPGETFGQPETLPWVEETLPVKDGSNTVIWDELYAAIREGVPFRIQMAEALEVMRIASATRQGTPFMLD
jgi:scyllo-inositol 2-dehydrogenase (NADP+)